MTGDNKNSGGDPTRDENVDVKPESSRFMASVVVSGLEPPKLVKTPWYGIQQKQDNKICSDCGDFFYHGFTYLECAVESTFFQIPRANLQTNRNNSLIIEYVRFFAIKNNTW